MTDEHDGDAVPSGFAILYPDEPFEIHAGPQYYREQYGDYVAGFRARPVHANAGGVVHGGALTAFADSALTAFALRGMNPDEDWVATISLTCDFVAPARPGDWIECRGAVTGRTRALVFVRGEMTVDDATIVTCSTVLRRLRRDRQQSSNKPE